MILTLISVWWEWMMMMNCCCCCCWCRLGLRRREWKYREVWWMKKCKRKWKKCRKNIDLILLLVLILNGDIFGGSVIVPLTPNFRFLFFMLQLLFSVLTLWFLVSHEVSKVWSRIVGRWNQVLLNEWFLCSSLTTWAESVVISCLIV